MYNLPLPFRLRHSLVAVLACSLTLLSTNARAASLNVPVTADTFINSGLADNNDGAHAWFDAGRDGAGGVRRGLLRFDLSGIPAGSTINSASLQLTVIKVPNGGGIASTFDLFRLLANWGEGTKSGANGAMATAGEANWNVRIQGSDSWNDPGAMSDVLAAASAATVVDGAATYTWTSAALAGDVQFWLNRPAQNFGWLLASRDEDTARTVRGFAARENLASDGVLTIDYTPPLAIDMNDRSFGIATNTPAGFDSFIIGTVGSSTLIQTAATVRTFGTYTVTISGNGVNPGYDDRLRTTPTNSAALSHAPIYRDFIFSPDTGAGGLNATVAGLVPNQAYRVTIWSFDQGNTGNRVSDWSANGSLVVNNFTFNGSNLPTNDTQYQLSFKASADTSGQIAIQGRRDSSGVTGIAVFLNALKVETTTPDAPTITVQPSPVELYVGDKTALTAGVGGTAPFTFQWYQDGSPIPDATNLTYALASAQSVDSGSYTFVAANSSGSDTSAPAALIVRPVLHVTSGLIAYWPLDSLTTSTPDTSGHGYDLNATNLDGSNLVLGQRGNAIYFNGNDEFLTRTNAPGELLPAYSYPAYTVAMWVKGYYTNQSDRRVWCESANTNNTPLMSIGTDNAATNANVDIFIRNNNGVTPHNHKKSVLPAFDGNWHHIAWVDNNGAALLFVDGQQDATDFSYTRGLLTPNIASLGVVYRTTNVAHFNGTIDDAAVWRRSLSGAEVQSVMASGPLAVGPQPTITGIQRTPDSVTLISFPTAVGYRYTLYHSDTLPASWIRNDAIFVAGSGGEEILMAGTPPGTESRFYQVRVEPLP